jgi:cytochrome c553
MLPGKAPFKLAAVCCLLATLGAAESIAADAAAGRQKARACAACHGIDGIAKMPIAPHIAGESQVYLETQLKAFRSGKRENEIMSVVAAVLSDEDISDLAAWYASIEISVTLPE